MNISKEEVNSLALKITDLIMREWDYVVDNNTRRHLVEETLYSQMEEYLNKFFEYPAFNMYTGENKRIR